MWFLFLINTLLKKVDLFHDFLNLTSAKVTIILFCHFCVAAFHLVFHGLNFLKHCLLNVTLP